MCLTVEASYRTLQRFSSKETRIGYKVMIQLPDGRFQAPIKWKSYRRHCWYKFQKNKYCDNTNAGFYIYTTLNGAKRFIENMKDYHPNKKYVIVKVKYDNVMRVGRKLDSNHLIVVAQYQYIMEEIDENNK